MAHQFWSLQVCDLLARQITSQEESHLATMDIVDERNAYDGSCALYRSREVQGVVPMTFIRTYY